MAQNQPNKHQYFTPEELKEKESILENTNTLKKEKRAHLAFTQFLQGITPQLNSVEYWLYETATLNTYLCQFWLGVRQQDGQKYKLNSLQTIMYGINRILKRHGFPDIHKSDEFSSSRRAFDAAKKELVKEGLGTTDSAPDISEHGEKLSVYH